MQGLELWVPLGHVRASWKVSALWLFLKTSQTSCFPGSSIKSRSFAFSSWAQGDTDTWVPNATSQSGQCKVGMKTSGGADVVLEMGLSTKGLLVLSNSLRASGTSHCSSHAGGHLIGELPPRA